MDQRGLPPAGYPPGSPFLQPTTEEEIRLVEIALARARSERMALERLQGIGSTARLSGLDASGSSALAGMGVMLGNNMGGLSSSGGVYQGQPSLHQSLGASRPLTDYELQLRSSLANNLGGRGLFQSAASAYATIPSYTSAPGALPNTLLDLMQLRQMQQYQNVTNVPSALELALRGNQAAGVLANNHAAVGLAADSRLVPSLLAQRHATNPIAFLGDRSSAFDGTMGAMNYLTSSPMLSAAAAADTAAHHSAASAPVAAAAENSSPTATAEAATPPHRSATHKVSSTPKRQKKKRKYDHEPFPAKLHRLLREAKENGKEHIVRFSEDGLKFQIVDTALFETEILGNYFRHNNISSFKRLLRMYGFKKISGTWMQGTFEHDFFKRDNPELAKHMDRVGGADKAAGE